MAAVPQRQHLFLILALAAAVVLPQVASASSYRCGWCPRRSTASLLPPDAGAITGASCGYGPETVASELTDAGFHIAAVSAGFFRDGRACGACYQLRCRGRTACAEDGVKVVVVADAPDTNVTGDGGFMLTRDAFAALTNRGGDLLARQDDDDATIDIDFRRIPCAYRDKNLSVRVDEASVRSRGRLVLRFLYQGGQTDIAAVEVAQAVNLDAEPSPASMWRYMTRREGSPGVWSTSRAPAGPLRFRVVVTAGSGGKWLQSAGAVLPAEWAPGGVYDTGLRVADVAASTCGGASCGFADESGDKELR
ncbi:expansin-like A4 [Lolium rigidum]|uniref:expansin-like A4 n=1 Tax=Lolium rigidum TaxID=89674 RepID=UPI001F5CDBF8|nr:expansin-like A4 [Lolium rigidum]